MRKQIAGLLLCAVIGLLLAACGVPNTPASTAKETAETEQPERAAGIASNAAPSASAEVPMILEKGIDTKPVSLPEEEMSMSSNILVAYFSCTGNTAPLAEYAAEQLHADLYEIIPEEPYTEEDLAYYTDCRADREQNDPSARPAISGSVENMEQYDTVLIGYPIWHGQAPRIISTFLESYDFSGKTIVPFCTSASSGIGSSAENLHSLTKDAAWLSGSRFAGGASKDTITEWINSLDLPGKSIPYDSTNP